MPSLSGKVEKRITERQVAFKEILDSYREVGRTSCAIDLEGFKVEPRRLNERRQCIFVLVSSQVEQRELCSTAALIVYDHLRQRFSRTRSFSYDVLRGRGERRYWHLSENIPCRCTHDVEWDTRPIYSAQFRSSHLAHATTRNHLPELAEPPRPVEESSCTIRSQHSADLELVMITPP